MKFKSYYIISNKRTRVNSYFALLSDQLAKSDLQENAIHPDLVIIFGGDGSLLRAIKKYHKKIATTYFLLINLGEIGFYDFFANFPKAKIIEALFANELQTDALDLLKLKHQGEELYALNEIKIIDVARPVRIDIFLNEQYFEHFRGTGLSFATKTGAAGFNKSLGGPVIVSDKSLWSMVEIAPVNNYKLLSLKTPLVLDEQQRISLKGEICNKSLLVDTYHHIYPCDDLAIALEPQKLKIIVPQQKTTLATKIQRIFIRNGYQN